MKTMFGHHEAILLRRDLASNCPICKVAIRWTSESRKDALSALSSGVVRTIAPKNGTEDIKRRCRLRAFMTRTGFVEIP